MPVGSRPGRAADSGAEAKLVPVQSRARAMTVRVRMTRLPGGFRDFAARSRKHKGEGSPGQPGLAGLPFAETVAHGKGLLYLPIRVRCWDCDEVGLPCDACCYGSFRRRVAALAWSNICASWSLCFWVGRLRATRCWYVHSSVSACHVASTLLWWQAISVTGTDDALLTRQQLSQTCSGRFTGSSPSSLLADAACAVAGGPRNRTDDLLSKQKGLKGGHSLRFDGGGGRILRL